MRQLSMLHADAISQESGKFKVQGKELKDLPKKKTTQFIKDLYLHLSVWEITPGKDV